MEHSSEGRFTEAEKKELLEKLRAMYDWVFGTEVQLGAEKRMHHLEVVVLHGSKDGWALVHKVKLIWVVIFWLWGTSSAFVGYVLGSGHMPIVHKKVEQIMKGTDNE